MADPTQIIARVQADENVATFEWHQLHLHVVTRDQLPSHQIRVLERALRKVAGVGEFADLVSTLTGRSVRIRTERPSPDIRIEVGL
jgi:hypothetical protein